jgi:hypothetical protein
MRFQSIHFRSYRGSTLSSVGEAPELVYRRDTGEFVARDAKVVLSSEDAAEVHVSAAVLDGDLPGRSYEARGGVRMDRSFDSARTASARCGPDGIVRGEERIDLVGPGYRMWGPSFTLDPKQGELVIRGGARVIATGREASHP